MADLLPTYLRKHRRKWALTQCDLARLLGEVSTSAISKYETLARTPRLETMLALEVVFDEVSESLFPALAEEVRRAVVRNAIVLRDEFAGRTDARSIRKHRLLDELISRSQQPNEGTS